MNKAIFRALLQDVLYQVLDNKVFRLLALLTLIPILLSFLVGFREEEIVFFFGLKTLSYSSLPGLASSSSALGQDLRIQAIQALQGLLTNELSGNMGILACIAATSFFVPRMLERGTADTLFSKPLSRATLLLARYLSGVLFVFLLSSFLVVGVHMGLMLVSGYSDPGFLWGALTLTYIFALVHSFSTLVATLTRSSIAAILCTLAFFMFTGCTHFLWVAKEQIKETQLTQEDGEVPDRPGGDQPQIDIDDPWIKRIIGGLDVVHYTLPKTSDADALTSLLRRSVGGAPYLVQDETGGLRVAAAPTFGKDTRVEESRGYQDDTKTFDLSWEFSDTDGDNFAKVQIQRFHSRYETLGDGAQGAQLKKTFGSAFHRRTRQKELKETDGASAISGVRGRVAKRSASFVRWTQDTLNGNEEREEIAFGYEGHTYVISSRWKPERLTIDKRELHLEAFLGGLSFPELEQTLTPDSDEWLKNKLSFTAPLKYNILFSIGSSLAFALSMLFLSWLALRRINF